MPQLPITLQEQQMTGCDFPASCKGEGATAARSAEVTQGKFQAHLSHPSSPFPSPSPSCLSTAQAILQTDGTWAGKQTNWLPPAGALRAFKADECSLAKSPAVWRRQRNLPSLAFLHPCCSMAPAASLSGCKHAAGSSWEPVAGGDGCCILNQAPGRGNSG